MTMQVLQTMVDNTNQFARHFIATNNLAANSRIQTWVDTACSEMKKFIGIIMYMGLVQMPSIHSNRKHNTLYRNVVASTTMNRNRFQLLLRIWHLTCISSDASDKLHKIRCFADLQIEIFDAAEQPGEDIVVDESMVPFRGRLKFKQYIPSKSHKYGIKLFKLCDSTEYTFSFIIYEAKA
jgi:Transposase IS4